MKIQLIIYFKKCYRKHSITPIHTILIKVGESVNKFKFQYVHHHPDTSPPFPYPSVAAYFNCHREGPSGGSLFGSSSSNLGPAAMRVEISNIAEHVLFVHLFGDGRFHKQFILDAREFIQQFTLVGNREFRNACQTGHCDGDVKREGGKIVCGKL